MTMTTRILPRDQWKQTFEEFTKRHLRDERTRPTASIEVMSLEIGDQIDVRSACVLGVTWDEKNEILDVALENVDHVAFHPHGIAVIVDDDGFITELEVQRDDGSRELVHFHKAAPLSTGEPRAAT